MAKPSINCLICLTGIILIIKVVGKLKFELKVVLCEQYNTFWYLRKFEKEIVIIFIMLHYQHGYPWPSLASSPYHPLFPTGLQGYIQYRHRIAVCRFALVILSLLVHLKGSTGVHHLWARPYFSSRVPHVWFV